MAVQANAGLDAPAKAILIAAALVATALIVVPLTVMVLTAFRGPSDYLPFEAGARWSVENVVRLYTGGALFQRVLPDTLRAVSGTVILTTALAFTLAWLVERTDLPGRGLVYVLVLFPLFVPVNVLAVGWIYLLGPNAGWLNVGLRSLVGTDGSGPLNVFSMPGLIMCQSLALTPYMFILLSATIRTMNPSLEEASATSGASPLTTFRRVTLPVLLPGLLAPVILILIIALEQFELPLMIGLPARLNIFAYRIYYELHPADGLPNYGAAAAISFVFLVISVLLLLAYNRVIRHGERYTTVTGKAYRQRRLSLGRCRWPALAFVAAHASLAAILPATVLVATSLTGYGGSGVSFEAYRALLADPRFWLAARNTLVVATASAVVVTALGGLLGWIIVRTDFRWRKALDFLSFTSIGIPSVIVGLALMMVFLSVPNAIYGTVWILLIAYSGRLATTTRTARAGLMQIHPELEEASAASGARWLTTQLRIVLPLLRPALLSAFVLFFIIGVREFTIPLVLASDENMVLAVLVWRLYQGGNAAPTAALATLIIAAMLPLVLLVRHLWQTRVAMD